MTLKYPLQWYKFLTYILILHLYFQHLENLVPTGIAENGGKIEKIKNLLNLSVVSSFRIAHRLSGHEFHDYHS